MVKKGTKKRNYIKNSTKNKLSSNTRRNEKVNEKVNGKIKEKMKEKSKEKSESAASLAFEPFFSNERNEVSSLQDIKTLLKENTVFIKLLLGAILLVFINSIIGAFVSDDIPTYVENPVIRSIGTAWSTGDPITIKYSLFYAVFGNSPIPLHLYSILLHMICTVLVFVYFNAVSNKKLAMAASLIFALHPVVSESVAWISAAKYIRTGILTFTILLLHHLYIVKKDRRYVTIGALLLLVALFIFKDDFFLTIPAIALVANFAFYKQKGKDYMTPIAYFLAVVPYVFIILRNAFVERVDSMVNQYGFDGGGITYFQRAVFAFYMVFKQLFFPKDLSIYHEGSSISQATFYILVAFVVVTLVLIASLLVRKKFLAGALIIILLGPLPIFFPVQIANLVAERYLYVSVAFFALFIACGLSYLEKRIKVQDLSVILLVAMLLALSVRTVIRNNDWKNTETLWKATAKTDPYSPRVYNNLGDVYANKGEREMALQMFAKAIELRPNYADAIHNYGFTLLTLQRIPEAKEAFLAVLEINPNIYQTHLWLAQIYFQEGNLEETERYLNNANILNPDNPEIIQAVQQFEEVKKGI